MFLTSHFYDNNIPKITHKAINIEDNHLLGQNKKKRRKRKEKKKEKKFNKSAISKDFFHQLGPLGRVGLVVDMCVCLCVCVFVCLSV